MKFKKLVEKELKGFQKDVAEALVKRLENIGRSRAKLLQKLVHRMARQVIKEILSD